MKTKQDKRVWLDRYQGREEFGVFPDQKFYSVEYDGPNKGDVIAFAEKVAEFNEWCRTGYLEKRAGREIPDPPAFVTSTKPSTAPKKRTAAPSKSSKTSESKQEDTTDGTEAQSDES